MPTMLAEVTEEYRCSERPNLSTTKGGPPYKGWKEKIRESSSRSTCHVDPSEGGSSPRSEEYAGGENRIEKEFPYALLVERKDRQRLGE